MANLVSIGRHSAVGGLVLAIGLAPSAAAAQAPAVPITAGPIRSAIASEVARTIASSESREQDDDDAAWRHIERLPPGRSLVLTLSGGTMEQVRFERADAVSLTIAAGHSISRTIPRDDVLEIKYPPTYHARHGLLIGLAAGAGYGITRCWGDNLVGACGIFGGGIGLGIGSAIGGARNAFSDENLVVYRAAPANPSRADATTADIAWSAVRQIGAKEHVRVSLQGSGEAVDGAFESADAGSIGLLMASGVRRMPREQIDRVSVSIGSTRARHVGMALLAGTAMAVAIRGGDAFTDSRSARPPLFFSAMGASAIAGALLPAHDVWKEIYIAAAASTPR